MIISDETRKKRSEAAKIRWANPEFKARASEAMRKAHAEKGCSAQTRVKLSAAIKARLADPEYKKRVNDAQKAKWQDPEYRKHMSEVHKGKYSGPRHPMFGKKHTEESRKKMSQSHPRLRGEAHPRFGKSHTPEVRERMSKSHKGKPLPEATRIKIGLASKRAHALKTQEELNTWNRNISIGEKGKHVSLDTRVRISAVKKGKRCSRGTEFTSELLKARYRDPEYIRKMKAAWNIKPNKSEAFILKLLNDLYPGEWKYTGDFSLTINGKCPDFVNCNGKKLIIEFWGDHWHRGEKPQDRVAEFEPFGYRTLVIWGHEMRNLQGVIDKISAFVRA